MRTMFDHMDKNHNGYVTPKELKCYLRANNIKVTNKEVKEFFNSALVANLFIIPYVKTFGIQSYHNI
ncbi:putative calmodulin [Schistosoma japonicum]|uniref:Putative calmodulin n=1 Tax=Schistosoma japonicum TaxID=6182 RepID=A0A4Z2CPQ7_SCHJA|nr:putative calmodulin [Schistosoma japonicum]